MHSIHTVGYIDHVPTSNLVVGCKPSYSSISIEEIDMDGNLIPLDIQTVNYDCSIRSCCFNEASNLVCISTANREVHLWDLSSTSTIHTFDNVNNYHPLTFLQRFHNTNTWLGSDQSSLVLIDQRESSLTSFSPSISNIHSFSLTPNREYLRCSFVVYR